MGLPITHLQSPCVPTPYRLECIRTRSRGKARQRNG